MGRGVGGRGSSQCKPTMSPVRQLIGRVVSDKMQKSIVVAVDRTIRHPKYEKVRIFA